MARKTAAKLLLLGLFLLFSSSVLVILDQSIMDYTSTNSTGLLSIALGTFLFIHTIIFIKKIKFFRAVLELVLFFSGSIYLLEPLQNLFGEVPIFLYLSGLYLLLFLIVAFRTRGKRKEDDLSDNPLFQEMKKKLR